MSNGEKNKRELETAQDFDELKLFRGEVGPDLAAEFASK